MKTWMWSTKKDALQADEYEKAIVEEIVERVENYMYNNTMVKVSELIEVINNGEC